MNKIIMLSGGAESTAVLMNVLLEATNIDKIHVHHINLYDSNNRMEAEAIAVKKIIEYCRKNIRPEIKFTSNHYTSNFGRFTNYDILLVMFIAGDVVKKCYEHDILKGEEVCVYLGVSHNEKRNKHISTNHDPKVRFLDSPLFKASLTAFQSNFFNWKEEDCNKIYLNFPILNMNFEEYWKLIPEVLHSYICSCRTPSYIGNSFIPCGVCNTCQKLNILMRNQNESKS